MNSVSDNPLSSGDRQFDPLPTFSPRAQEEEDVQDITALFSHRQGEVFICNEDTHGLLECLPTFKGKMINALGGGFNKLYVIQDTEENEGIVSSLHPPELDEYDAVFSQETTVQDPFEYLTAFDDKGTLSQIRAGRKHLLVLTDSGHIFSWGKGEYGALGLSGVAYIRTPKLIKPLSDKKVVQIACGEYHSLALTSTGDVYAWGRGFEGQLGLAPAPIQKKPEGEGNISKKKKKKLENPDTSEGGLYHGESDEDADGTSTLKKNQPLYNPGNINAYHIETASTPKYVKAFFNNPIQYIACGAYFSLAINNKGQLYGWGENKLSQLGQHKPFKFDRPQQIMIYKQSLKDHNFQDSVLHMKISLKYDELDQKKAQKYLKEKNGENANPEEEQQINQPQEAVFKQVAAGYGHTIALTEDGDIYAWGFNMKGQLGIGDVARGHTTQGETKKVKTKLMKPPTRIFHDQLSNPLPKFQKIACGYYTSFAIDEKGHLYSWGGGAIGHKDEALQDVPRVVEAYTENRKFTDIFCTMKSTLFFAPIRVISMQPKSGPSSGGTIISLLGTGFADTGNQKVRFSFGKYQTEVECGFNPSSESLYCVTPKFDEFDEDGELWPLEIEVSLSLDGHNFIPAEEKFLIYNSNIAIISMVPKNASVNGRATLTLDLNIDDTTAAKLKDFTIGFQAKKVDALGPSQTGTTTEFDKMSKGASMTQSGVPSEMKTVDRKGSFGSATPKAITSNRARNHTSREAINPLGVNVLSPELDKEDWIAVRGYYQSGGRVTCKIPQIDQLGEQNLFFNVDVSLNGQQFTGLPSSFRFYDIKVERMSPNNDISDGNSTVTIEGNGFVDSDAKKLKFVSQYTDPEDGSQKQGERLVDLSWLKEQKQFCFIVPPITWLFGGAVPTPEQIDELKHNPPRVYLTLNSVEWLEIGTFFYFDPEFDRIAPSQVPENQEKWATEDEEPDIFATCKNDNEIEKKKQEQNKIMAQEDDEIAHTFKKPGQYLWLRGKDFIRTRDLTVMFISGSSAIPAKTVYKNATRIGCQVPEIDELTPGVHEIGIELSYNGQQFSKIGKGIKYLSVDKNLSEADRKKFEDEEAKKLKVTKKK